MSKIFSPHTQCQPKGFAAELLSATGAGEDAWWQEIARIGTPLVEHATDDRVTMSFFWRDPQGDETRSPVRKVYADINCVTDHHSPEPQSLQRLPGTDVWYWSVGIEKTWRGSYSFIPVTDSHSTPLFSGDDRARALQQREWWISLFPLAIADPLNAAAPRLNSRGHPLSAAHMPDAPDQSCWQQLDAGDAPPPDEARLHPFTWQSALLNNQRRVWLYTTGDTAAQEERPLAIILDGQNWVEGCPLFSALDAETAAGRLPPAVYLMIDVISMAFREQELPCNPLFWQAVEEELLPMARARTPFSQQADRTLVAGQSYGGLAATYAGLHRPQRFGRVLSQSGSFWWPDRSLSRRVNDGDQRETGWLTEQLISGSLPASKLTVFMEAGSREGDMAPLSEQMHAALVAAGHRTFFRIFAGGHDGLCWRGGLTDGLRWLMADFLSPNNDSVDGNNND